MEGGLETVGRISREWWGNKREYSGRTTGQQLETDGRTTGKRRANDVQTMRGTWRPRPRVHRCFSKEPRHRRTLRQRRQAPARRPTTRLRYRRSLAALLQSE